MESRDRFEILASNNDVERVNVVVVVWWYGGVVVKSVAVAVAVVAGIVQCSSIIVHKVRVYVKMAIIRNNEALIT